MPVTNAQKNRRLLVGFVLDRSGSMGSIQQETIENTNAQFKALRKSDDADNTHVCFFTFNQTVSALFQDDSGNPKLVSCDELKDLSNSNYFPSGSTAMFDAVGDAIDFLSAQAKPVDDVLVIVISDGINNASTRHTSEKIASQVKELQDSGWNFTYIGANQDLTQVQSQLGIHRKNIIGFSADASGTKAVGDRVTLAVQNYTVSRSAAHKSGKTGRHTSNSLYDDIKVNK